MGLGDKGIMGSPGLNISSRHVWTVVVCRVIWETCKVGLDGAYVGEWQILGYCYWRAGVHVELLVLLTGLIIF